MDRLYKFLLHILNFQCAFTEITLQLDHGKREMNCRGTADQLVTEKLGKNPKNNQLPINVHLNCASKEPISEHFIMISSAQ